MPEARGSDPKEPHQAQGQRRQLGGATHAPGLGQWPEEHAKERWLCGCKEGLEEPSHIEGQEQQW